MSRSYKKHPIVKDNKNGRKFEKRQANKKVRRTTDIPDGRTYRKVYWRDKIYDFVSHCTLEEYLQIDDRFIRYKTEQEKKNAWEKYFRRK